MSVFQWNYRTFLRGIFESRQLSRYNDRSRVGWSGFDPGSGQEIFLYSTATGPALGPTQPRIQWVHSGRCVEADYLHSSSAEIKNGGTISSLPNTSSWRSAQFLNWSDLTDLFQATGTRADTLPLAQLQLRSSDYPVPFPGAEEPDAEGQRRQPADGVRWRTEGTAGTCVWQVALAPCFSHSTAAPCLHVNVFSDFCTDLSPRSRDSSVGIATGCWSRGRCPSPGRAKNFLFSTSSTPALGSTQLPIQ
jgi:hypothetical protein